MDQIQPGNSTEKHTSLNGASTLHQQSGELTINKQIWPKITCLMSFVVTAQKLQALIIKNENEIGVGGTMVSQLHNLQMYKAFIYS